MPPQNAREIARKEPVVVTCDPAAAEVTVRHRARNQKDDGLRPSFRPRVWPVCHASRIYDTVVEPVVPKCSRLLMLRLLQPNRHGKNVHDGGKVSDEKHRGISLEPSSTFLRARASRPRSTP